MCRHSCATLCSDGELLTRLVALIYPCQPSKPASKAKAAGRKAYPAFSTPWKRWAAHGAMGMVGAGEGVIAFWSIFTTIVVNFTDFDRISKNTNARCL